MLKNKTRVKAILFSLLALAILASSAEGAGKEQVVTLGAPSTTVTINLGAHEPAATVILKDWYCDDNKEFGAKDIKKDTASVLEHLDWFTSHILTSPNDADAKNGEEFAREIIELAGKGVMAFWSYVINVHKRNVHKRFFHVDAVPGDTMTYVKTCYSKDALEDLMRLEVDAARNFIDAMNAASAKK